MNAAKALGLGSDGIVWVDTNDNYTTNIESLQKAIDNLPPHFEPFMVVAVAGNCRTSSIDDLSQISKICEQNNIWFHVDACHGGSLLFSEKLKKHLAGIEQADSVTIDPHKSLFVTYSSSYVLFKKPNVMNIYCRYPEQLKNSQISDIGLITPFYGSRGFDSLKLWLLILHLGQKKLGEYIEKRTDLYKKIVERLTLTDFFVFLNSPQLYRSVFVFFPKAIQEYLKDCTITQKSIIELIEKYTTLFSDALYQRGKVIVDLFKLNDFSNSLGYGNKISYPVIGMSIGHIEMSESEIDSIIEEIVLVGNETQALMMSEIQNNDTIIEKIFSFSGPASW